MHSDLWSEADKGAVFRNTKAHRTFQEAREQDDLDDYIGNDTVDELCRSKASDLLPQQWKVNAYMAECEATRACNRFIAQMLTTFTDAQTNLLQRAKQARQDQASTKPIRISTLPPPHAWQWDRSSARWVCTACGTRVTKKTGRLGRSACLGHWGKVQSW